MGMIFDIKRFALHDGPGIRTTIFFKGCPLTCFWCHNPEGKSRKPEFMWSEERCIQCRTCESVCPDRAISFSDTFSLDESKCTYCGACVNACSSQALELIGKDMTAAEIMNEIEKDEIFYDESGGGVTFSGGEPLMQPDFLYDLLSACTSHGIHTAVDTCGYAPSDALLRISCLTDLFLYDIKIIDDEIHRKVTGVSNALILENLKKLLQLKKRVIVRFPLIPEVNDSKKDVLALGEFLSSLNVREVSILPYHKGGIEKLKRLQKEDAVTIKPPFPEVLDAVEQGLKRFGLNVGIGG